MHIIAIHDRPARDLCGIYAFVAKENSVNRVYGFRDKERTLTDEEVRAYVERGDFLAVDVELEAPPTFKDLVLLWVGYGVDEECQRYLLPRVLNEGGAQAATGSVIITERYDAERRIAIWTTLAAAMILELEPSSRRSLALLMLSVDHRSCPEFSLPWVPQ